MVTKNSLLAYAEALENINHKQLIVYKALRKLGEANNQMLSRSLNWQINSITPRVYELRKMNLIKKSKDAPDQQTGRKTTYWKPVIK